MFWGFFWGGLYFSLTLLILHTCNDLSYLFMVKNKERLADMGFFGKSANRHIRLFMPLP